MEVREALSPESVPPPVATEPVACPQCGDDWGALPPVSSSLLGREPLRRCERCGSRFAVGGAPPREIVTCETCGLPFHADELLPDQPPHCPNCRTGRFPAEFTDPDVVRATEVEVRAALEGAWTFVGAPDLGVYLDRIAREVARRVPGAPRGARVVVFEDRHVRSLALPSGTILVSLGLLAALEDEAELAFVLAHELAHVAAGDAGARLVWLGVDGVSRDTDDPEDPGPWVRAAHDVIRLGHGRRRERDADRVALEALLELDYDPQSVLGLLDRLEARIARGSERVRELAASHPTPAERRRRIERQLLDWVYTDAAPKVNRAAFRQAAGHSALSAGLSRRDGIEDPRAARRLAGRRRLRRRRVLLAAGAIAILAALFLAVGAWLAAGS